jgi:hypothetical protein
MSLRRLPKLDVGGSNPDARVDRHGQVSQVRPRFLGWQRKNTMRPMTGLHELREHSKMTWIALEVLWERSLISAQ